VFDIFEAADLCFPILFPLMEESLKSFILRRFPGYKKACRAEQIFSREGNAIIDNFFFKKLTKKAKKEAIENAPKLHQYHYLPDKKSPNI